MFTASSHIKITQGLKTQLSKIIEQYIYHQSLFYKPCLKVKTLHSLEQLLIVENLAILFVKTRALKIHALTKTTLKRCIDRALI